MSFRYSVDQQIFCYFGQLLWEARILEQKLKDGQAHYQVHYRGWNKHWDELVPESRIVEFNEENAKEAAKLKKQQAKAKKAKRVETLLADQKSTDSCPSEASSRKEPTIVSTRRRKTKLAQKVHKVDYSLDESRLIPQHDTLPLEMPNELTDLLMDAEYNATRQDLLLLLPPSKSVRAILEEYMLDRVEKELDREIERRNSHPQKPANPRDGIQAGRPSLLRRSSPQANVTAYVDLLNGLVRLFNQVLGVKLLFPYERGQLRRLLQTVAQADKRNSTLERPPRRLGDGTPTIDEATFEKVLQVRSNATEPGAYIRQSQMVEALFAELAPHVERPLGDLSTVYGLVHLLRLLDYIPRWAALAAHPSDEIDRLVALCQDVVHYLHSNLTELEPTVTYEYETMEYYRRARHLCVGTSTQKRPLLDPDLKFLERLNR